MAFTEHLELLLKKHNTTQKALAAHLGIRYASISDWKKGVTFPRADVALQIAQYLGTTVEFLLTGVEPNASAQKQVVKDHCLSLLAEIDKL
jgi:transcriptional regulator with XRE-family HTH domain